MLPSASAFFIFVNRLCHAWKRINIICNFICTVLGINFEFCSYRSRAWSKCRQLHTWKELRHFILTSRDNTNQLKVMIQASYNHKHHQERRITVPIVHHNFMAYIVDGNSFNFPYKALRFCQLICKDGGLKISLYSCKLMPRALAIMNSFCYVWHKFLRLWHWLYANFIPF